MKKRLLGIWITGLIVFLCSLCNFFEFCKKRWRKWTGKEKLDKF